MKRRRPRQRRAQLTVDAILDSVTRLLKRGGVKAVTTNRIAEVAGVSIGSVYQYFPDKQAIFDALHDRHVGQMGQLVEDKLAEHAGSSLDDLVRALVEATVAAHAVDPELHELLFSQVPHRAGEGHASPVAERRLQSVLRRALEARPARAPRELERTLFVLTHMIEALGHGAVLDRPARLSLAAARDEAVRAVLAYLHA